LTAPGPLARRIVDDVRALIRSGELKPGDRLPTHAELRKRYGCSITPVREAMSALKQAGIVYGHAGRAVYVAEAGGSPAADGPQDLAQVHERGFREVAAALREIAEALRRRP
jgi:GntR family transcriptional regulator